MNQKAAEDKKLMMALAAQELAMYQAALEEAYQTAGVRLLSSITQLTLAYQNVVLGKYGLYDEPETTTPEVPKTPA